LAIQIFKKNTLTVQIAYRVQWSLLQHPQSQAFLIVIWFDADFFFWENLLSIIGQKAIFDFYGFIFEILLAERF
jgi:hypothetical protein